MAERKLTGRTVFLILVSAFGVAIGVNAIMAALAIGTFPGLETRNPDAVSQTFEAGRSAQLALGWDVSARFDAGVVRLTIVDSDGISVEPAGMDTTLGRATRIDEDIKPEFRFDGMDHVAVAELAPGNWNLRLKATAADGTEFRQRVVLHVDERS